VSQYAAQTEVPADRSRAEIERILERYGATSFLYGWDKNAAMIAFEVEGRRIRIMVPMPQREWYATTPTGRKRVTSSIDKEWEQGKRQRWRAMALIVNAKLEAVQAGISTIEAEFLAYTLLPNNQTIGDWLGPQIQRVYETQTMPPMLPGVSGQALLADPGDTIEGEFTS
jgi:hypothetical protein